MRSVSDSELSTTKSAVNVFNRGKTDKQDGKDAGFLTGLTSRNQGPQNTCFQLAVVIFTLAGLAFHTWTIVDNYLSYPTSETTSVKQEFVFPDVTLCHSARRADSRARLDEPLYNVTGLSIRNTFRNLEHFWLSYSTNMTSEETSVKQDYRPLARKSMVDYLQYNEIYKHKEDYVIDCLFADTPCSFVNFSMVFDTDLFYCSTFKPSHRQTRTVGSGSGLELLLYGSDSSNIMKSYKEYMHFYEGFYVILHPQGTYPSSKSSICFAEVSQRTDISISMKKKKSINLKRKPCMTHTVVELYNHNVFPAKFNYSAELCTTLSIQDLFVSKCGCLSPDYPVEFKHKQVTTCLAVPLTQFVQNVAYSYINNTVYVEKNSASTPFWSAISETKWFNLRKRFNCYQQLTENLPDHLPDLQLQCPSPCEESVYSGVISKRSWPSLRDFSLAYTEQAIHAMIKRNSKIGNDSGISTSGQDRYIIKGRANTTSIPLYYLYLTVYPSQFLSVQSLEERSYQLGNFWSDFGGCVGLWSGWSAVTLFLLMWSISSRLYFLWTSRIRVRAVKPFAEK